MKKTILLGAIAALALVSCSSSHEAKTVALNNQNDSLNYALGYANGAQVKMYYLREDSTFAAANEFLTALENGYNGKVKDLTPAESMGRNIGTAIKQMEETGVADKAAWTLNEKIFFQGLINGMHHDTTVMTAAVARDFFQTKYAAAYAQPDSIEPAKAIKGKCNLNVKTITLATELDSINYAFGYFNGDGIAQQFVDNDTTGKAVKEIVAAINRGLKSNVKNPQLVQMGESIGKSIREQEAEGLLGESSLTTDFPLILQGFTNGMKGFDDIFDIRSAQEYVQTTMDAIKYGPTKAEGELFLEENAKREGVIVTESGLQYEVLVEGKGKKKPAADDEVTVHYRGTLINGTEFDSSYKRNEPTTFGVSQVIKGWTEALQLMTVGSKYKLYIPYNLAYGERGAGQDIPPYATLIFEVELLSIK